VEEERAIYRRLSRATGPGAILAKINKKRQTRHEGEECLNAILTLNFNHWAMQNRHARSED
jgi:hypothetical protein